MANIPLLGWDPTNPLVAWSCTCLSDAAITAAGGTWRAAAAHDYHATYGARRTAYAAGAVDLLFDFNGLIAFLEVPNYQLSFDIQTDQLVAYLANSVYFNGINAAGPVPLLNIYNNGFAITSSFQIRVNAFANVSGLSVSLGAPIGNTGKWVGGISNLSKNFMTRVILVRNGKLMQIYVEHQDSSGSRIGIPLLTDSGQDMNVALGYNGNYNIMTAAAQPMGIRYLNFFVDGGSQALTALNCYIRNIQLIKSAPTNTAHPALRSIASIGDSYASVFAIGGNGPNPANTNSGTLSAVTSDLISSDTNTFVRALGIVKHKTGVLNHITVPCEQGGTTLCVYNSDRAILGTPNKKMTYLTTDFLVPCGAGAPTKTQLARANSTPYAIGVFVVPATANGFVYTCLTQGTSAAAPPTFNIPAGSAAPTTAANTTDGTVTWKCIGYDHKFATSGVVSQKYLKPSILWQFAGFNDCDYIQQNLNNPLSLPMFAGYNYANNYVMYDALWKLWVQSLLDIYPEMIFLVLTVPIAPNALLINGTTDPLGLGRVPAINLVNGTYRSAPAYFQTLTPSNSYVSYKGRVHCIDYARATGITSLAASSLANFSDGTHISGRYMLDKMVNAMVSGIETAMAGGTTNYVTITN